MKKNISLIINFIILNITLFSDTSHLKKIKQIIISGQQNNVESVLNINLANESDLVSLGIHRFGK